MKLTILKSGLAMFWLMAAALPRPAAAQWAVFDASNLTNATKIWKEDISMNQKMVLELQQGLKLYQNAVQLYGVASQEASYLKNKQILMAAGFLAQNAMIPGHPEWDKAMTAAGGVVAAGSVWKQMTARGGTLKSRIAMADSFAVAAMNSVGSCNAAAAQNDNSLGKLEQMAVDLNPAANSRANQANLSNMASTQALRVQECQHNLQLQQAKLQLLAVHAQRDQDQYLLDRQAATAAVLGQLKTTDTVAAIYGVTDR